MTTLQQIVPRFLEMAHSIVWASVATVGPDGRPRSRVLHPLWEWDGTDLVGWIATGPTPVKTAHIAAHPQISINYWRPDHDTCSADCEVQWVFDDDGRTAVWQKFADAPAPVGYDPAIIPGWNGPTAPAFAAWRLTPYRLRVMDGTVLLKGAGAELTWRR